ncbi:N-acetyltransferase family protein [Vibrio diabolicus]
MPQSELNDTKLANIALQHAETPEQLANCFSVISRLRPALKDEGEWIRRALFMKQHDYHVLVAWENDTALAVAGYRFMENLIHGNFIYVDDLITAEGQRNRGLGSALLTELTNIGKHNQCDRLVLDTLATNEHARRFYQREGLNDAIVGFYKNL